MNFFTHSVNVITLIICKFGVIPVSQEQISVDPVNDPFNMLLNLIC